MKEIILAYQGEMTLKGLNRSKFEARLAKSIRYRLEDLGKFKVTHFQNFWHCQNEPRCLLQQGF